MINWHLIAIFLAALLLHGCSNDDSNSEGELAAVTAVEIAGLPGDYTFSVTIESPDTGCNQYADWWEVITADGNLIYRRILAHSHVNEQPFARSGGPVKVAATQNILVRAHMNSSGYGERVLSGTVEQGLTLDVLDSEFSAELEAVAPLPVSCDF